MASALGYGRVATGPELGVYHDGNGAELPEFVEGLDISFPGLSTEERKRLWWRNALINMMFIAFWFVIAILLSVYNKWMFSPDRYGFTWPLFVTAFHMFVQFGLAALVRNVWSKTFRPPNNPGRKDYGQKVVPTAVATSLDIGLSNLSLKLITLSFYTMCKSSSLIFVLFFAFLFRLERFSLRLVGVIFLIFIGVLLMVATKTNFVLSGFILITSASALGGLRWSLTHLLLKNKEVGLDNPAATIFWLAPVMGAVLSVLSLAVEDWSSIFASKFFDSLPHILSTALFMLIPGTMAFCMVLTEYSIVQRAGVVPMSIAGIAKEVTQISVSAWLFGDELTPLNVVGVAVTACGIALYTYHKYRKSVDSREPLQEFESEALRNRHVYANNDLPLEERQLHNNLAAPNLESTSRSHESVANRVHAIDDDCSELLFNAEQSNAEMSVGAKDCGAEVAGTFPPPGDEIHPSAVVSRLGAERTRFS